MRPDRQRGGCRRRAGRADRAHYGPGHHADRGDLGIPTLYLLRHAKSSWDEAQLPDHDRPLAPRGRRAAQHMAEHLRHEHIVPALVLCSSAARTRETLELIGPALGPRTVTRVLDSLYLADADDLLDHVRAVPAEVQSILLVGHNPGLQELAIRLAAGGPPAVEQLHARFPTGAIATLRLRGFGWQQLATGCADLVDFTLPRDLEHGKSGRHKR